TGYRGRVGVFEVLKIDESVRGLINAQTDGNTIDKAAVKAGMTTMLDDGGAKCRGGITSNGEVLRVTTVPGSHAEFPLSCLDTERRARERILVRPDRGRGRSPHRVSRPGAGRNSRRRRCGGGFPRNRSSLQPASRHGCHAVHPRLGTAPQGRG